MLWRNSRTKKLMMSRYDQWVTLPSTSVKLDIFRKIYERYIDSLETMEQLKEQYEKKDPKRFSEIIKKHKEDGQGLFDNDDPLV